MEKMNREITHQQLQQSRDKNIDTVMKSISQTQKRSVFSMVRLNPRYVITFVLLLTIILTLAIGDFGNDVNPPVDLIPSELALNTSTTEVLSELSYISASLMSTSFTVANDTVLQIAAPKEKTLIETDIEEINTYFDMLKVFLEDNPFGESIVVEELVDDDYQSKITFTSEGNSFEFYINITDQDIEGILYIDDLMYIVEGKQVVEESESKLQLRAINGNDYVDVEYKTDFEDLETVEKYSVETSFSGVITEKDIKVSIEDGNFKVTIEDLTSKYNLKKNTDDDQGKYKLDYTIDGEKGRATIYEDVDVDGNPVYRYEIREGDLTATILVPMETITTDEQNTPLTDKRNQIYST
jgi:HSP20 family molecular chaperone IbpA